MEYARKLGFRPKPNGLLENGIKVVVKRNDITYHNSARLDDLIDVYTRVSYIKNTSFCFEHILINPESNALLVNQKSVHVNLNPDTNLPEKIPDVFRNALLNFEGKDMEIIKN
jgi:acyl-CoA thioester hydrolase